MHGSLAATRRSHKHIAKTSPLRHKLDIVMFHVQKVDQKVHASRENKDTALCRHFPREKTRTILRVVFWHHPRVRSAQKTVSSNDGEESLRTSRATRRRPPIARSRCKTRVASHRGSGGNIPSRQAGDLRNQFVKDVKRLSRSSEHDCCGLLSKGLTSARKHPTRNPPSKMLCSRKYRSLSTHSIH